MNANNFTKFVKAIIAALFVVLLLVPRTSYAGTDNGVGNGGENNGHGNDKGSGGSVPINSGLIFLAFAGVAYCGKKFYDLKKKQPVS